MSTIKFYSTLSNSSNLANINSSLNLKTNCLCSNLIRLTENVEDGKTNIPHINSATHDSLSTDIDYGLLGEIAQKKVEAWLQGATKGFFNWIEPIMTYGLSSAIVICLLIYISTNDKKSLTNAVKIFFIYVLYCYIRGAVNDW